MPLVRLPEPRLMLYYFRHLLQAKQDGHGVHSPFAYRLCEEVFYNHKAFYEFEKLENLRAQLLKNNTILEIHDMGAGSKNLRSNVRKVAHIAKHGISSAKQSQLLFRLINYFDFTTIVEFGSSLGLNTLYLAQARKKGVVYSMEGSESLQRFAKELAQDAGVTNIHFLTGNFDTLLPKLLQSLNKVDLAYIDGNHSYEATLRYFEALMQKIHQNSVLVFDDIYWSEGMHRAWEEIKKHPRVSLSIDTFYSGYVFFREEIREKQHYRFLI